MANPFLFFYRCIFLSIFKTKERTATRDLFTKFSYRYTIIESRSILNPFRYFKMSARLLLAGSDGDFKFISPLLVYDGKRKSLTQRQEYLRFITGKEYSFLFRDSLPNRLNYLEKRVNLFFLSITFLIVLPVALFRHDRSLPSLILLELSEICLLSKMILKYDFREILIFSAYEKEIFFLSYLLKCKTKLKVSLIPSPNPISLHYKAVICDVFNFTAPFQPKELKKNGFEWHVTNTQMWPPHGAERIGLNKDSTRVDKFKIGFMSSGMALRQHLKHTNITGNSDYFAEDAAVKSLKQYMQKTGDAVIVYFHPLEKASPENIAFSENFYRNAFGNNVEFAPYDRPSKQNFHLCDVAIAGFSSVQIERLYGGYKTLFAPMGFLKNYFGDDRLDAVSANSDEELVKLLEECKKINADVFFEKFGLKEYRWDSYEVKFPSEV